MSDNGTQEREDGMAAVLHHTPEAYADAFHRRFWMLVATYRPFTSEAITNVIGAPPNHPNAVGALMNSCVRTAKAKGKIRADGWTTTSHTAGHARGIRVYRGVWSQ